MNKFVKKASSFFLCAVLLFSMATMASASIITWPDDEGGKTLVLSVTGTSTQQHEISEAPEVYHVKGDTNTITYNGTYSATATATGTIILPKYLPYLEEAMAEEDMYMSMPVAGSVYVSKTLQPTLATGTYTLAVIFTCKSADWGVSNGIIMTSIDAQSVPVDTTSGTISDAPTSTYTIGVIRT